MNRRSFNKKRLKNAKNALTKEEKHENLLNDFRMAINPPFTSYVDDKTLRSCRSYDQKAIYRFRQAQTGSTITASTTLPVFGSLYFQINNLDQIGTFAPLFDQYRIDAIEACFFPNTSSTTAATNAPGLLYITPDYDDANAVTAISQVREYADCIMHTPTSAPFSLILKPRAALAAYSGTFTSYANMADMWIDCNSSTVQHYGLKYAWEESSATFAIEVVFYYYLSFRMVH